MQEEKKRDNNFDANPMHFRLMSIVNVDNLEVEEEEEEKKKKRGKKNSIINWKQEMQEEKKRDNNFDANRYQ